MHERNLGYVDPSEQVLGEAHLWCLSWRVTHAHGFAYLALNFGQGEESNALEPAEMRALATALNAAADAAEKNAPPENKP